MEPQVRVLIADDRPTTRQGLKALLSLVPQVMLVGEAADGQECVDLVMKCNPDVVVMDLQLPVMDGVEATRLIKERWPAVRVIALTMHARYRSDALAAGVDAFLLKDGQPEPLLQAILGQDFSSPGQPVTPWSTVS
jgi:DNA-binding NarL/FixJ family response regulator